MKKTLFILLTSLLLSFVSCKKDNATNKTITLSTTSVTLHYEDVFQITAQCDSPITYTSNNPFHAEVTNSGLVTAKHVGTTTITLSSGDDTKTFTVIVNPRSNLYPEPDIEFGETKESIIAKFGEPDILDTIWTPNDTVWITHEYIEYTNYSTNAPSLTISFDENNCVQEYSLSVYSPIYTLISDFLIERYLYEGGDEYINYYINGLTIESATKFIIMSLINNTQYSVLYLPIPTIIHNNNGLATNTQ